RAFDLYRTLSHHPPNCSELDRMSVAGATSRGIRQQVDCLEGRTTSGGHWRRLNDLRGKAAMRTRFTPTLFTFLLCLLMGTGLSWGQEVTAAISGQVSDASGAAIANATVTARDLDRGTTWPAQANESGYYSLPRLPIGKYEVRVEAKGFQTAVKRSLELEINQNAKIDFQMQVGQVSQTMEVTSAPP